MAVRLRVRVPLRRGAGAVPRSSSSRARTVGAGDREVTVLLATGEVQGDGLAGVEVDNGRARVAAERGAVVRDELLLVADLGDLAGREPLDVVDVAEDAVHVVGDAGAGVLGGIADDRDSPAGRCAFGQRDGLAALGRGSRTPVDAEEGHVGTGVVLDVEHLEDAELRGGLPLVLFLEVDASAHLALDRRTEYETVAVTPAELGGDVPVGDHDVVVHDPAGADPVEVGVVVELDAADGEQRLAEGRSRLGEARLPRIGVVGGEDERVPLYEQHRPAQHPDDRLEPGVERRGRRGLDDLAGGVGGHAVGSMQPLGERRTFADLCEDLVLQLRIAVDVAECVQPTHGNPPGSVTSCTLTEPRRGAIDTEPTVVAWLRCAATPSGGRLCGCRTRRQLRGTT